MSSIGVAKVGGLKLIGLRVVALTAGERVAIRAEGELCAVVLSGSAGVSISGAALGEARRDGDFFDTMGDAVYVPPGETLELVSPEPAAVAIASAPSADAKARPGRIVRPSDQSVREAGTGNWSRTVRTILGPEDEAGRLIVGETVSPSGNWSSYPPHKHDRHAPPHELALEEAYLYRFRPEGGFGVQLLYDDDDERAQIVRDGDVVAIPYGYHPVVAAPGYELYYLWAMAGEERGLAPFLEPAHAWVQETS